MAAPVIGFDGFAGSLEVVTHMPFSENPKSPFADFSYGEAALVLIISQTSNGNHRVGLAIDGEATAFDFFDDVDIGNQFNIRDSFDLSQNRLGQMSLGIITIERRDVQGASNSHNRHCNQQSSNSKLHRGSFAES